MTEPIKILLLSNVYPVDECTGTPAIGIQQHALEEEGFNFDVISIETGNKLSYLRAAWLIWKMNFHQPKYDLIHAYYGLSVYIGTLQKKIPVVGTFLGSDLLNHGEKPNWDTRIGILAAKRADGVIVMSEEMKKASGRADAEIIPFSINLNDFQETSVHEARQKLGLSLENKYVLFPWNPLRKVKRFEIIEEAVKILQREIPEVELVIIYNQPHSDVVLYMNACDVVVLASDHEGSPVAIREAMACNLPIISVNVGDVAELIEGVSNSFLVERDPTSFVKCLRRILSTCERSDARIKIQKYATLKTTLQIRDKYHNILAKD